jgi:CDGSH-type Zn-finger protein
MAITIRIKENGPYQISLEDSASVVIVDAAGNRYESTPGKGIALCRCGQSATKPFCDRTHREVGFRGALTCPPAAISPGESSAATVDRDAFAATDLLSNPVEDK